MLQVAPRLGGRFDPAALFGLAAELSGAAAAEVEAIGATLLQLSGGDTGEPPRSTLNNDATPLQVCLTCHADGRVVRLIGDPGSTAPSVSARLAEGRRAIAALIGPGSDSDLFTSLLDAALPQNLGARAEAAHGILWLAATPGGEGDALYVKARWDDAAADWDRAAALVRRVMRHPHGAESDIVALRGAARLVSVGVERAGPDRTRLKLYWRLERPALLASLGIPLLADATFAAFLSSIVGASAIARSGLVFSMSYSLATGRIRDVKLDICAHCVPRPAADWSAESDALAARFGLVSPNLGAALAAGRADIAFVGLGVDTRGCKRLNLYLKTASATLVGST